MDFQSVYGFSSLVFLQRSRSVLNNDMVRVFSFDSGRKTPIITSFNRICPARITMQAKRIAPLHLLETTGLEASI